MPVPSDPSVVLRLEARASVEESQPRVGCRHSRRGSPTGGTSGGPGPPVRQWSTASLPSGCQSSRDLPLLINQCAHFCGGSFSPAVPPYPASFSGRKAPHPAHVRPRLTLTSTLSEILSNMYVDTMVNVAAVLCLTGQKTASERFTSAIWTWTCEGMMGDGEAPSDGNQPCSSSRDFARAFEHSSSQPRRGHSRVRVADLMGGISRSVGR